MIPQPQRWRLAGGRSLDLGRARLLAIINVTPDSFSDGGEALAPQAAAERAARAVADGADMLDVGGESTRPGASRIDEPEQIRRVVPAIRAIRAAGLDIPISVDTTRAAVARAALDAGADAINDVSAALEDPAMLALAAERAAGIVLMHRAAPPPEDSYSDQHAAEPRYDGGVVAAVRAFLTSRADAAVRAGIHAESIVLDPGLGFGKSVAQNFALIARIGESAPEGYTLLSAASRKSFIGAATGKPDPRERVEGSVAVSVAHRLAGVRLFRVHDVAAHAAALRTIESVIGGRSPGTQSPRGSRPS